MVDLAPIEEVTPPETLTAWPAVREAAPRGSYLVGGTALALHLRHRVSQDLDLFVPRPFRVARVREILSSHGDLLVSQEDGSTTLNCLLGGARIQFLHAEGQHNLDPPTRHAGVLVAGMRDLLAMKLKVISDRGELRDYYDLKAIEQHTRYRVEQGLRFLVERYEIRSTSEVLARTVRALGYLDDVIDDPSLPERRRSIADHWRGRVGEIGRSLTSFDPTRAARLPDDVPTPPEEGRCAAQTTAGHPCPFRAQPGSRFCGHHRRG